MKTAVLSIALLGLFGLTACNGQNKKEKELGRKQGSTVVKTAIGNLTLPAPFATESAVKMTSVKKWPAGMVPKAPDGFVVTRFADNLKSPRNTYIGPNNDVFVAESATRGSANRITILRDKDNDGVFETRQVFIDGLNQPYGMLIIGDYFYIANTDGVYRYPYKVGDMQLTGKGEKIVELTKGGYNNHWTRNLIASKDNMKIYISVGSASNVGEHGMEEEHRRANILEVSTDGKGEVIYASGLRNPVGMDWNPATGELWTAVNERDELGDDLVPDYITSVKRDGFYGWPYSYFGQIEDIRMRGQRPDLVAKAIIPDVPVGSHTASLGLTFYEEGNFPQKYKDGAFVGQHGSWNRSVLSGYKVLFVPFKDGKPVGQPQDFLTGFIADERKAEVYGRPVDVTVMKDGSLLVNDDEAGIIWKVAYKG